MKQMRWRIAYTF